ncbi:hypothetical protein [Streptomyces sp. NPDC086023]|uniref:hypothetical protein n=1 Tax=Streptomyces sp. NPDC086023 TaxID=3365746 RepID=UPI0037D54DFD
MKPRRTPSGATQPPDRTPTAARASKAARTPTRTPQPPAGTTRTPGTPGTPHPHTHTHTHTRTHPRTRTLTRTLALTLALPLPLALLTTGCGGSGRLESAGPTPIASGPVHLWPQRQGASVLPADPAGAPPEYVTGIPPVTAQNVHQVDPVALVKAEIKEATSTVTGPDAMPPETIAAIGTCTRAGAPKCPVLAPYYRDLTGNGRDELIIGIELPDRQLAVRAFTADPDGRLNRIMGTIDSVIGVELAGRDVIIRVPGGNAGYEWIIAWSWDEKQRTMLPTRDQIVRVAQPHGPKRPATSPTASPGTAP